MSVNGSRTFIGLIAPRIFSSPPTDATFAKWLAKQPRKSWVNANLFIQPAAVQVAVLPDVPYWDVELFRERDNVVATLQPLNCHLPECLGVPSYSSFCHSQFLSLHGVPIASVSASGFSPLRDS